MTARVSLCKVGRGQPAGSNSLELFAEFLELFLQILEFFFQLTDTVEFRFRLCQLDIARKEMGVPDFFLSGLPRQPGNQRGFAGHQRIENRIDFLNALEIIEAIGPSPNFSGGLWPTKHKDAQHTDRRPPQIQHLVQEMPILRHPRFGAVDEDDKLLFTQSVEHPRDRGVVEMYDGMAI